MTEGGECKVMMVAAKKEVIFLWKICQNYKVCKSYYNPWSESVCSLLSLVDMLLVYIVAVPLVLHCIVKDKMMILMMTS